MKTCLICGENFIPKHNAQRFCEKDHFSKCPICGSEVVWNSLRAVRPCCKECSDKLRKQTTLHKYDVENVMRSDEVVRTRKDKWLQKVHALLPIKLQAIPEYPQFKIDDSEMSVYLLTEEASVSFLRSYGFRIAPKFGKKHMSFGLVQDGILYQVLRFESHKGEIELSDFGVRGGYFNPNYYSKLLKFAFEIRGIEEFTASIPRNIATSEVVDSLCLKYQKKLDYEVFWKIDDSLRKLNRWDNIEEMLKKYDYVTSDRLDLYSFSSTAV